MITRIQKWGTSQGLRLSKELLSDADLAVGDAVEVSARDGTVVMSPIRPIRSRRDLSELVERIPAGYQPGELDWSSSAGGEVW